MRWLVKVHSNVECYVGLAVLEYAGRGGMYRANVHSKHSYNGPN